MRSRLPRSLTLATALATLLALAGSALPAAATTTAQISPSFAPDRAGARTSVTFAASFSSSEGGLPSPLRKISIMLPYGLANRPQWPLTYGCSHAHLAAHGARGCPAHSEIGTGSAQLQWQQNGATRSESARLALFVGPTNGAYTLQLLAEGRRPIHRRVVFEVALAAISAPFSAGLQAPIAPIPTLPGGSDASIVSFSMTVGRSTRPTARGEALRRWGEMGLFVPTSCPAGGYPWVASFEYASGEAEEVAGATPCA